MAREALFTRHDSFRYLALLLFDLALWVEFDPENYSESSKRANAHVHFGTDQDDPVVLMLATKFSATVKLRDDESLRCKVLPRFALSLFASALRPVLTWRII
ncbi:hypothetical protein QAD02_002911 [Eretmocerus hayati]|uniref:Uncharacterized protein n=1 Tax=Eretmocerus hayati TaxID=131215 RepID=A0ACC2NN50_9HYME|nr:hypothetical protein QAD02_002911 [Eretmocerus hayati]